MFVLSYDVSAAKRVIATLLATAMVLWGFGLYTHRAEAANITSVSDTMTDTSPGGISSHTFHFNIPDAMATASTTTVVFPTGFNVGSATTVVSASSTGGAAGWTVTGFTGQTLTLTRASALAASSTLIFTVSNVTNPSSPTGGDESYVIPITAGIDSGYTRVVILNTVLVTAQVAPTFTFTVNGVATSTQINGTSTTGLSSSTTIPFGQLVEWKPKILGQRLNVATNARNGYVVTVHSDGYFKSSTGAVIDDFANGDATTTPISWKPPANVVTNNKTWGHWGITSTDTNVPARTLQFASDKWVGVSTTPTAVMGNSGPADGTTNNIGSTSVAYQVEISPLQEAGDDYTTTLTYVATPTF